MPTKEPLVFPEHDLILNPDIANERVLEGTHTWRRSASVTSKRPMRPSGRKRKIRAPEDRSGGATSREAAALQ